MTGPPVAGWQWYCDAFRARRVSWKAPWAPSSVNSLINVSHLSSARSSALDTGRRPVSSLCISTVDLPASKRGTSESPLEPSNAHPVTVLRRGLGRPGRHAISTPCFPPCPSLSRITASESLSSSPPVECPFECRSRFALVGISLHMP